MTLPRELSLRVEEGSLHLVQAPIRELTKRRGNLVQIVETELSAGEKVLEQIRGDRFELEATFEVSSAREVGFIVHQSDEAGTVVGYDVREGQLLVDHRGAGQENFHHRRPIGWRMCHCNMWARATRLRQISRLR